jgi:hypothetical protein
MNIPTVNGSAELALGATHNDPWQAADSFNAPAGTLAQSASVGGSDCD